MSKSTFCIISLFAVIPACTSDQVNTSGQPTPTGSSPVTWTAEIDGALAALDFQTQAVTQEADSGVLIVLTGERLGKETSVSIDVAGSLQILIPADDPATPENEAVAKISVGNSGLNIRLKDNDLTYRATSGTVSFTAYGFDLGNIVTGSVDLGLVTVSAPFPSSAALKGDFSGSVAAPSSP